MDSTYTGTLYFAVDIEKIGYHHDSAINAFGTCLGTSDGEVIETNLWCPAVEPWQKFDVRCKETFWNNNLELLELFKLHEKDARILYKEFEKYFDKIEERFPKAKIQIVSDNPSFDLGTLDYHLNYYTGRYPLRYTSDGKYRSVQDPDERAKALCIKDTLQTKIDQLVKHDHNPKNDALYIYHFAVLTNRAMKVFKERTMCPEFEKLI